MCHSWLAAGVLVLLGTLVARELGPVVRAPAVETGETGFLGSGSRGWFRGRIESIVRTLLAWGVSANTVTAVQLVISVLCAAAYAHGWIFTGGWLLLTSGALDVLDGELARRGGAAGPRGAFVDSVVDRYGECALFTGLVVYFRHRWPLWAVLAALFGAFMVSYARARAEGLGVECRIGLMQRPERYVVLGGGSMVGALAAHVVCRAGLADRALAASVVAVAVLANVTALQRVGFTMRRLS